MCGICEVDKNCSTCAKSTFLCGATHVCAPRDDMSVAEDYFCEEWGPLLFMTAWGPQVFGNMKTKEVV